MPEMPCFLTLIGRTLAALGADGERVDGDVVTSSESDPPLPTAVKLHESYPNPFSNAATIAFDLPEAVHVQLSAYDVLGREVRRLIDGPLAAGRHKTELDAAGLPSGFYLLTLEAEDWRAVSGVVLAR